MLGGLIVVARSYASNDYVENSRGNENISFDYCDTPNHPMSMSWNTTTRLIVPSSAWVCMDQIPYPEDCVGRVVHLEKISPECLRCHQQLDTSYFQITKKKLLQKSSLPA